MPRFSNIAADAKADYDKQLANAADESRRAEAARKVVVEGGKHLLSTHIMPLLDEARADLNAEGIEFSIAAEFEVHNRHDSVLPTVSAHCLGPKRASDGYQWGASKVFFSSNGKTISVGHAKNELGNHAEVNIGSVAPEQVGQLVEMAVRVAVDDYYRLLKEHPAWAMKR